MIDPTPVKLSICAPVYNEEANIASVVTEWKKILDEDVETYEIILTNDGSTDKTESILKKLETQVDALKVIHYKNNHGYGFALSSSIKNSKGKYIITIDSDGQFELSDYRNLLIKLVENDYDAVTGQRTKKKDTYLRVIADRILNLIVRLQFRINLNDTNCALKIIKGDCLRDLIIESNGYPTPTEICIKLFASGAKIGEEKVTHLERKEGESKLKLFRTGIKFLLFLIFLKYKLLLYKWKIINKL